jgi:hypothetical protein
VNGTGLGKDGVTRAPQKLRRLFVSLKRKVTVPAGSDASLICIYRD